MVQLLKYLKSYKKDAILTPVLVVLETIGELCLTIIIGRLIDQLSNSDTTMATITTTAAAAADEGFYFELNGQKLVPGMAQDDMISRLCIQDRKVPA